MILTEKYKNIPVEMKQLPQWVGFMRTPILKDGKPDKNADGTPRMSKIPIDVHTLGGASSIAVHSWGNFERAMNIIGKTATVGRQRQQGTVKGVGFVFHPDKNTGIGICGIDLDHIIDPNTKQINAAAKELLILWIHIRNTPRAVRVYICIITVLVTASGKRNSTAV